MGACVANERRVRLLGLGNEILADDAFGIRVAEEAHRRVGPAVDVVVSCDAGFNLIDRLTGVEQLLVVDTVQTGKSPPGTISVFEAESIECVPGISPHTTGILDVLAVAKALGVAVPERVTLLVVEAADCCTVGGAMHPAVRAAIPRVVQRSAELLGAEWEAA